MRSAACTHIDTFYRNKSYVIIQIELAPVIDLFGLIRRRKAYCHRNIFGYYLIGPLFDLSDLFFGNGSVKIYDRLVFRHMKSDIVIPEPCVYKPAYQMLCTVVLHPRHSLVPVDHAGDLFAAGDGSVSIMDHLPVRQQGS